MKRVLTLMKHGGIEPQGKDNPETSAGDNASGKKTKRAVSKSKKTVGGDIGTSAGDNVAGKKTKRAVSKSKKTVGNEIGEVKQKRQRRTKPVKKDKNGTRRKTQSQAVVDSDDSIEDGVLMNALAQVESKTHRSETIGDSKPVSISDKVTGRNSSFVDDLLKPVLNSQLYFKSDETTLHTSTVKSSYFSVAKGTLKVPEKGITSRKEGAQGKRKVASTGIPFIPEGGSTSRKKTKIKSKRTAIIVELSESSESSSE